MQLDSGIATWPRQRPYRRRTSKNTCVNTATRDAIRARPGSSGAPQQLRFGNKVIFIFCARDVKSCGPTGHLIEQLAFFFEFELFQVLMRFCGLFSVIEDAPRDTYQLPAVDSKENHSAAPAANSSSNPDANASTDNARRPHDAQEPANDHNNRPAAQEPENLADDFRRDPVADSPLSANAAPLPSPPSPTRLTRSRSNTTVTSTLKLNIPEIDPPPPQLPSVNKDHQSCSASICHVPVLIQSKTNNNFFLKTRPQEDQANLSFVSNKSGHSKLKDEREIMNKLESSITISIGTGSLSPSEASLRIVSNTREVTPQPPKQPAETKRLMNYPVCRLDCVLCQAMVKPQSSLKPASVCFVERRTSISKTTTTTTMRIRNPP